MHQFITLSLLILIGLFPGKNNLNGVRMEDKTTTFIILRHAEKDGTDKDPNLSADGLARADELRKTLGNVAVNAIYSTGYKRTKQTVTPLANEKGIAITEYQAKKPYAELVNEILAENRGKTVVLVGHSNTVPEILKVLSNNTFNVSISESQFDNLFIVAHTEGFDAKVLQLKYGKATP